MRARTVPPEAAIRREQRADWARNREHDLGRGYRGRRRPPQAHPVYAAIVAQTAATVRRTYYVLTAGNTLAASLIWGINTIFLLDAGLSNFEAFAANAFYTAGMVLFEIPTGVVADSRGRRISFLWGTVTLAVATGLYVLLWQLESPFVLVGARVGAARARLHLLLRGHRGLAGRRADRDQVRRDAGGGLLPRPGGRPGCSCCSARWPAAICPADQSRACRTWPGPAILVVMFVLALMHDARPRLHPRARQAGRSRRSRRSCDNSVQLRAQGPGHPGHHAVRASSSAASASTSSTRCSPTCSTCGATRRRTGSPVWSPRSSPAPRSSAA